MRRNQLNAHCALLGIDRDDAGAEVLVRTNVVEAGYTTRRVLRELVQNAHDACPDGSGRQVRIRVAFDDDLLVVEHDGEPFDERDLEAITRLARSDKGGEKLGRYGRGFKSVFTLAPTVRVISFPYAFDLHDLIVPDHVGEDVWRSASAEGDPWWRRPPAEKVTRFEVRIPDASKQAYGELRQRTLHEDRDIDDGFHVLELVFLESLARVELYDARWGTEPVRVLERESGPADPARSESTVCLRATRREAGDDEQQWTTNFECRVRIVSGDPGSADGLPVAVAFRLENGHLIADERLGRTLFMGQRTRMPVHLPFAVSAPFEAEANRDQLVDQREADDVNGRLATQAAALWAREFGTAWRDACTSKALDRVCALLELLPPGEAFAPIAATLANKAREVVEGLALPVFASGGAAADGWKLAPWRETWRGTRTEAEIVRQLSSPGLRLVIPEVAEGIERRKYCPAKHPSATKLLFDRARLYPDPAGARFVDACVAVARGADEARILEIVRKLAAVWREDADQGRTDARLKALGRGDARLAGLVEGLLRRAPPPGPPSLEVPPTEVPPPGWDEEAWTAQQLTVLLDDPDWATHLLRDLGADDALIEALFGGVSAEDRCEHFVRWTWPETLGWVLPRLRCRFRDAIPRRIDGEFVERVLYLPGGLARDAIDERAPDEGALSDPEICEAPGPLRGYQRRAVRALLGAPCSERRALLVLPAGTGKTRVALETLCRYLAAAPAPQRVLWLAHRSELIDQAAAALPRVWCRAGDRKRALVWLKCGDERSLTALPKVGSLHALRFATLDAVSRTPGPDWLRDDAAGLTILVVDEAHWGLQLLQTVETRLRCLREDDDGVAWLGLTATPLRDGGAETPGSERLRALFRRRVAPLATADGCIDESRWLAPLERHHFDGVWSGDNVVDIDLVALADRLGERLFSETEPFHKSLIFVPRVDQAKLLWLLLRRRQVDRAAFVHGRMPDSVRASIIARYRAGELRHLISSELLTHGFDDPGVTCVVIARPTKEAPSLYYQMVGRGRRLDPCNPGKVCLLLDVHDPARMDEMLAEVERAATIGPNNRM